MKHDTSNCISSAIQDHLRNERGVALILVLIMLVVLSILGATILTSTTTDIRIAGNYRNTQDAFFTADAAIDYAKKAEMIYSVVGNPPPNLLPINPNLGRTVWPNNGNPTTISFAGRTADVRVDHVGGLSDTTCKRGSGTQVSDGIELYVISVSGDGPGNGQVNIEEFFCKE